MLSLVRTSGKRSRWSRFTHSVCMLALCAVLSSCANTLEYRKGLSFANQPNDVKYSFFEDSTSGIVIKDPGLSIVIDSNPDYNYLGIGPILPIIPWLPGIYEVIFHHQDYQVPRDNLALNVTFRGDGMFPASTLSARHYFFSVAYIKVVTHEGNSFPVDTIVCAPESCAHGNLCESSAEGLYSIVAATRRFPECRMTFKLPMSDLVKADLYIESLVVEGKAVRALKLPIKRMNAIQIGYIGL